MHPHAYVPGAAANQQLLAMGGQPAVNTRHLNMHGAAMLLRLYHWLGGCYLYQLLSLQTPAPFRWLG